MIPSLLTGQARGGDILIVDDVEANLKLLANLLTHAGYHVRPAGSASLALRSVLAQLPDLVLLDVRMPDIDGYELCRRLKADERTRAIPVMFISASVGVEERAKGFEVGAVDFIGKPFNEAEVLARVATHLALYHARQDLERNNAQLLAEVAQRTQVEDALQESTERYRLLVESIKDVVWTLDTETLRFLYVSPSIEQLRGYTAEEIMAQPLDAALTPESAELVRKSVREHVGPFLTGKIPPGTFYTTEAQQPCKDGSLVWTEAITSYYLDQQTGHVVLRGVTRDITERRQAEEALRENEQNYRTLADSGRALVWTAGTDKLCDYFNRVWLEFTGRTFEQELGNGWAEGVHPDDLQHCLDIYIGSFDRRDSFTMEYRLRRHDGEYRWILDDGSPRYDTKGEFIGYIGHCLDITERRQAEQDLVISHAALLEAQAMGHIGDWSIDAASLTFVWSDEMYLIHGLEPGTPVSHETYLELIHPDDRPRVFEAMQFGMTGKQQEFVVDYRIVRPDGPERFVTLTGKTVADSSGAVTRIRGTMQDITDRKRAEVAVQESGEKYHMLFDNMTTGFALHELLYDEHGDPADYRFLDANQAFERLTGLPAATTVGHTVLEVLPGTEQRWIQTYAKVVQTGTPVLFEEYSGAIGKWFETRAFKVAGNQFATIFADITERKHAEDELRESEDRFRAVFDQAAVGVALLNTKTGQFVRINQKYCDFLGYTMEEMLQKTVVDVTFPDDMQRNLDGIAELMDGSSSEFSYEKRYVRKDGSLVWGSLAISPLWKPGEKPTTYVHIAVVDDITDRKRAEVEKEAMQVLLDSRKMEAVGELAGGVAHNFNNLLTAILGSIALVQDALPPADPLREDLNLAETAARQAADLTRGLLAFSRSAVIIPKPICINDAVETALTMLHQSLPSTTGVVRDFEQTAWDALLDQAQMTQIIVTLGIHARDVMDGKGTISVTTRNVVIDSEYVRTHPNARRGDHVLLRVSDNGPSLAPDVLEHLFEPFFTTALKRPAAGLGLSIVYGAVKQSGGWIDVASQPGEGTTFDIYLPRSVGTTASQQPDRASRPQPKHQGTILVVEDEPVVSSITRALLMRSGYTVLMAAEGNSAIAIVRSNAPGIDLILLDMTMPGPSTDEITRAIRDIDPNVPILLNSGYTSNDAVQRMLDAGTVQGFLGKPYELHELLDAISRLMKRS